MGWKGRLYREREDLMSKYIKLGEFIKTCDWVNRNKEQHYKLLVQQFDCMGEYISILDKRIEI